MQKHYKKHYQRYKGWFKIWLFPFHSEWENFSKENFITLHNWIWVKPNKFLIINKLQIKLKTWKSRSIWIIWSITLISLTSSSLRCSENFFFANPCILYDIIIRIPYILTNLLWGFVRIWYGTWFLCPG